MSLVEAFQGVFQQNRIARPDPQPVMEELRQKAGFRIGAELFADLVKESGEQIDES